MNLIYGMAELRDYEGIQSLSTALAEYFRYLMADSSHSVPISRELECVDAYLRIQNIRYMDKIRFCRAKLLKKRIFHVLARIYRL